MPRTPPALLLRDGLHLFDMPSEHGIALKIFCFLCDFLRIFFAAAILVGKEEQEGRVMREANKKDGRDLSTQKRRERKLVRIFKRPESDSQPGRCRRILM